MAKWPSSRKMSTNQRFVIANSNVFVRCNLVHENVFVCTRAYFTYLRTLCCVCVCCSAFFGACAYNGGGGIHVVSSPSAGGVHSDIPSGLTAASCEPSAVSRQSVEIQQCSRIFLYWSVCTAFHAALGPTQSHPTLLLCLHLPVVPALLVTRPGVQPLADVLLGTCSSRSSRTHGRLAGICV